MAEPYKRPPDSLAHHVKVDGSARHLVIAAIRYLDTFVKLDGRWFFSERKLMVV